MLDPGTESIITSFASPAVLVLAFGFILNKYFTKFEELAKNIVDMQVKSAVTESRNALIDKLSDDLQKLRDKHTLLEGSVLAVWRVIDKERLSQSHEDNT